MDKLLPLISPTSEEIEKFKSDNKSLISKLKDISNNITNNPNFNMLDPIIRDQIIRSFKRNQLAIIMLLTIKLYTINDEKIQSSIQARVDYDLIDNIEKQHLIIIGILNSIPLNDIADIAIQDENNRKILASLNYLDTNSLLHLEQMYDSFYKYMKKQCKQYSYNDSFSNKFISNYEDQKSIINTIKNNGNIDYSVLFFNISEIIIILCEWKVSLKYYYNNRSTVELNNVINLISYKINQDLDDFKKGNDLLLYEELHNKLANILIESEKRKQYHKLYIKQREYNNELKSIIPDEDNNDDKRKLYNLSLQNSECAILEEILPNKEERDRYNDIYNKKLDIEKEINDIIPDLKNRLLYNVDLNQIIKYDKMIDQHNKHDKVLQSVYLYNRTKLKAKSKEDVELYEKSIVDTETEIRDEVCIKINRPTNKTMEMLISDAYIHAYKGSEEDKFTNNVEKALISENKKFINSVKSFQEKNKGKRKVSDGGTSVSLNDRQENKRARLR